MLHTLPDILVQVKGKALYIGVRIFPMFLETILSGRYNIDMANVMEAVTQIFKTLVNDQPEPPILRRPQ